MSHETFRVLALWRRWLAQPGEIVMLPEQRIAMTELLNWVEDVVLTNRRLEELLTRLASRGATAESTTNLNDGEEVA